MFLVAGLLASCGKKTEKISESTPASAIDWPAGLRVTASEHGFSPSSLFFPKGGAGSTVPVTFVRTTDQTCATEVVFPELGIRKALPLNAPVTLDLPSDTARTLTFQCGMAMYKGALVIR
jgi:plastocyanin domain-containing protein